MEEGSMESGWEGSDSSRGLNACVVSGENVSLDNGNRVCFSGDASNNNGRFIIIQGGKERDQMTLPPPHAGNLDDKQVGSSGVCGNEMGIIIGKDACPMEEGDLSLRQWLDKPERIVDHSESLHIFRQIVETVDLAHSQGVVINNVRPSCFVMSSFNRVSFIESASSSDSDSSEDALNRKPLKRQRSSSVSPRAIALPGVSQRASETSCLRSTSVFPMCKSSIEEIEEGNADASRKLEDVEEEVKKNFPLKQILSMEISWYTSPEEADGTPSSYASDIYRLGVLLFELFCTFGSMEEKLGTMSNLRHRVLPPQLLLKWPKEASFCLWLLHPQPSTRPKMSEVLQSEFLIEPRDSMEEREAALRVKDESEEQDLLQEFLLQMQQKKREAADKLQSIISLLSSDIVEVLKQQSNIENTDRSYPKLSQDNHLVMDKVEYPSRNPVGNNDSTEVESRKRFRSELWSDEKFNEHSAKVQKIRSGTQTEHQETVLSKSSRLMKNFKKLESAYFSTRLRVIKTPKLRSRYSGISSGGRGSIAMTEVSSVDNLSSKEGHSEGRKTGWIHPFLDGLSKYLSYSKLKVKADLKQGDLLNSSNLVCSLSFDRDKEFFATAGVNKKIKVFECDSILSEDRDIHYPVVEMAGRSKLSSLCWNSYIKSQIASSDFEGVVQVWDVTRNQVFMEMREHERRVWSVDFSQAEPTKLASGSDDGSIKLWNINQVGSAITIKTKANICCVQFPPDSARSIAIGSADHKIYCYDFRNTRVPFCTLDGHTKTVSYVKYVDSTTLVSASTDNSLKLWDLTTGTSRVLDRPLQTFTGHTNVKNFVGLSVWDGYIATGSETNEVFVYHKAFPMPVLSYKFSSTDQASGYEIDDAAQFISSVCWRGQSSTLVAANSTEEGGESSWSTSSGSSYNGIDLDEEEEINPQCVAETKAFWEEQQQLLHATLSRTTTLESKIREVTKVVLNDSSQGTCFCSKPVNTGGCRNCIMGIIRDRLQNAGFDSAICKSKWKKTHNIPAGEHTYVDVVEKSSSSKKGGDIRVVIELGFRAEFEIGRANGEYNKLINRLPEVFVGKAERLKTVVKMLCSAAKKCMKENKMHMGPWRKHKYMQAKWFSTPCERRIVSETLNLPTRFSEYRTSSVKPKSSMLSFDLAENKLEARPAPSSRFQHFTAVVAVV